MSQRPEPCVEQTLWLRSTEINFLELRRRGGCVTRAFLFPSFQCLFLISQSIQVDQKLVSTFSANFVLLRKVLRFSILSSREFKYFVWQNCWVRRSISVVINFTWVWIHWALHLSRIYPLLHFLGISCFSGTVSTNLHYFWTVCPGLWILYVFRAFTFQHFQEGLASRQKLWSLCVSHDPREELKLSTRRVLE